MKDSLFSGFALLRIDPRRPDPHGFASHRRHQAGDASAEYRGLLDRHSQSRAHTRTAA